MSISTARQEGVGHIWDRSLLRHTVWNLAGYAAPLLAAVIAIPILIRDLGAARYGVLTIAWGVVGYFGIFDMGLDNALTKLVGERIGLGDRAEKEINAFFYTALSFLLISSVIGGIIVFLISRPLSYTWLNIPSDLRSQTCDILRIFAAVLPFVVTLACFRGILYAHQRFDLINKVQIANGVISFLGPVAVMPFSKSLIPVVAVLAIGRILSWVAYMTLCFQVAPGLRRRLSGGMGYLRPLLTFGGWVSISNIAEPLFLYSDRLILGAFLSMSAVAYYATPFDLVIRLWIIPDAINSALFPAYVLSLRDDGRRAMMLLNKVPDYLFPAIFTAVLFVVMFSNELLRFWISPAFAAHSAVVMQWLAVGVFYSSIARIAWTVLIAAHRPDLPAKLVLFEAPVYILILCALIVTRGVQGAAIAWTIRAAWNCCILHAMTWFVLPDAHSAIIKNAALVALGTFGLAVVTVFPLALEIKMFSFVTILIGEVFVGWFYILSPEERTLLLASSKPS